MIGLKIMAVAGFCLIAASVLAAIHDDATETYLYGAAAFIVFALIFILDQLFDQQRRK